MPLPPLSIQRSNTMPILPVDMDIGIQDNPDLSGNTVVQDNPPVQEVPHDPAVENVVQNGAGPDMNDGNGQAVQFAANHQVGAGRDWDMHSAEGMLDMVRNSVEHL